ncbi:MAG: nucleoside recognition domain-containing protein [Bacteroidota bacterium]
MSPTSNRIKAFFKEVFSDTKTTSWMMLRIMIPVSIVVKILKETGAINIIGDALAPIMKLAGLPGEMGLVWATGMITNLFGGILAYLNLANNYPLTVAQITVLASMMLVAHTFPIELQVARKAGVKLIAMFLIRFVFAFILGALLNLIYSSLNIFNQVSVIKWRPQLQPDPTIYQWAIGEAKNYLIILLFIFSLIFLVKLLRELGIIRIITKIIGPLLRALSIGEGVSTITIVGLTLGVVYGGALIIAEAKNQAISRKDILFSMVLMGLCHSIIEDTILVVSLGADISGVLIIRFIFALIITFAFVKIVRRLPERTVGKYLLTKKSPSAT